MHTSTAIDTATVIRELHDAIDKYVVAWRQFLFDHEDRSAPREALRELEKWRPIIQRLAHVPGVDDAICKPLGKEPGQYAKAICADLEESRELACRLRHTNPTDEAIQEFRIRAREVCDRLSGYSHAIVNLDTSRHPVIKPEPGAPRADGGDGRQRATRKVSKSDEMRRNARIVQDMIRQEALHDSGKTITEIFTEASVSSDTFYNSPLFQNTRLEKDSLLAAREHRNDERKSK